MMDSLPEEVVEIILSFTCQYNDYKNCMLVCSLWKRLIKGIALKRRKRFYECVYTGQVRWKREEKVAGGTHVTERYSHSACYLNSHMYVFGGCTASNTTFNDLWKFDLSTRQWMRPLASGAYPTPKACASLLAWREKLVLFGGWSQPTPFPLHQAAHFFNHLHIYDSAANQWDVISSPVSPAPTAGHSACLLGDDYMIVFGGSHQHGTSTDALWSLNLARMEWTECFPSGDTAPLPRYGASMCALDNTHAVVIGGCGGPNMKFSDCWLLTFKAPFRCEWKELIVENPENCPPPLWCHPACKIGNNMAVFSKPNMEIPAQVLTRISAYRRKPQSHARVGASGYSSSSSDDDELRSARQRRDVHSNRSPSQRRLKQLEMLQKFEQRLRNSQEQKAKENETTDLLKSPMFLHSLDLSSVLSRGVVTWSSPNVTDVCGSVPEDTYFYTAVEGRGELILFGGVHPETGAMQRGTTNASVLSDHVFIVSSK